MQKALIVNFRSTINHTPEFPHSNGGGSGKDTETFSVLVVGQGLAGSWLSYFLWKNGISFRIIDNFHFKSASTVAAGLMNPIVPKRLTATWKSEELFPDYISATYNEVESFLQQKVYFPDTLIHKLFYHQDDILAWESQRQKEQGSWLGPVVYENLNPKLTPHLGYATIKHSAWVNIPLLIQSFQTKFLELGVLLQEKFDYSNLESQEVVQYQGKKFEKVIFCEGSQMVNNPWFGHLPFNPTKGEELLISIPNLDMEQVGYAGLHLIPFGENKYLVGSTFRWDDLSQDSTEWAKDQILEKFQKVYDGPFEVLEQTAGIRPAAKDRRPLVGFHPNHPTLGVFNGLGTKGLLLGPLMADYWVQHLINKRVFEPEIHVKRLFKHCV